MKRISILCATALIAAGTYTPAQAISTNEPGFFNQCQTAFMNDIAAYERDCNGMATKSLNERIETPPDPCKITLLNFPKDMRILVASPAPFDPCHPPI